MENKFKRNSLGLLEGIDYKYNEDGTVNWRALIPKKHLYVNNNVDAARRQRMEEKYKSPIELINLEQTEVADEDLIIKLSGLRQVSVIRGYSLARSHVKFCSSDFVAVEYWMNFIPNFETGFQEITFQENACAHSGNTNSMAKQYLVETATNRAFCRCVRNFLNINIVSNYELQNEFGTEPSTVEAEPEFEGPYQVLNQKMKSKSFTFAKLKELMTESGIEGADKFEFLTDIPKKTVFSCLSLIEKAKS